MCHVTSLADPPQLSLKSPEYCGVHDAAAASTPTRLSQHYMIVDLHKKMDVLWSFVKSHLKSKVVIFMSSCKQVRNPKPRILNPKPQTPNPKPQSITPSR